MHRYNTMKLDLVFPCHEDTDNMGDTAKGKFCGQCNKEVIDFTTWEKEDVLNYLSEKKSCGIFKNEHIDSTQAEPIVHIKRQRTYFSHLVASLSVMVLAITGCENSASQTKGKSVFNREVKSTKKTNCRQTLGAPMPLKIEEVKEDIIIDTLVTTGEIVPPPAVGMSEVVVKNGVVLGGGWD